MYLFDTNIIIYSSSEENKSLTEIAQGKPFYSSVISKIETLGFHKLAPADKLWFERIFKSFEIIPLTENIVAKSISIRQEKKIALGDAIIAATALEYDLVLVTNNTIDFKNIDGIKLFNPIKQ